MHTASKQLQVWYKNIPAPQPKTYIKTTQIIVEDSVQEQGNITIIPITKQHTTHQPTIKIHA